MGLLCTYFHSIGSGGGVKPLSQLFKFLFLSSQSINVICKTKIGDCSTPYADCAFMTCKSI